jgi:hypothetical protein
VRALAIPAVLLASAACVSAARDDMRLARAAYARCVAAEGERACAAEKEHMLAAERAYAEQAQRAWGCNPAHADCPPRR